MWDDGKDYHKLKKSIVEEEELTTQLASLLAIYEYFTLGDGETWLSLSTKTFWQLIKVGTNWSTIIRITSDMRWSIIISVTFQKLIT